MPDPLPFRRRAAALPYAVFVAHLRKIDQPCRLYRIDQIRPFQWRGEIWFGGSIHRTEILNDRATLKRRADEYGREVTALVADGWIQADEPS